MRRCKICGCSIEHLKIRAVKCTKTACSVEYRKRHNKIQRLKKQEDGFRATRNRKPKNCVVYDEIKEMCILEEMARIEKEKETLKNNGLKQGSPYLLAEKIL